METKLTIQERLKDLRIVDRGLSLEQLAEQTGLSKSALGKNDMNAMLEAVRQQVIQQYAADDLIGILSDIREIYRQDATTADGESTAEAVSKYLQTAMSYEGSPQEKQARVYLAGLGIDYDAITKEQFITFQHS